VESFHKDILKPFCERVVRVRVDGKGVLNPFKPNCVTPPLRKQNDGSSQSSSARPLGSFLVSKGLGDDVGLIFLQARKYSIISKIKKGLGHLEVFFALLPQRRGGFEVFYRSKGADFFPSSLT